MAFARSLSGATRALRRRTGLPKFSTRFETGRGARRKRMCHCPILTRDRGKGGRDYPRKPWHSTGTTAGPGGPPHRWPQR